MKEGERRAAKIVQAVLWILATMACAGALMRVFMSQKEWLERVDSTTLIYLAVAGALILVRDLKSLAFGDYKIEFYDRLQQAEEQAAQAREQAAQAQETARSAQAVALLGVGKGPSSAAPRTARRTSESVPSLAAPQEADDPWRGKFGGQAENRNRVLSASVRRVTGSADFFNLKLSVASTQPQTDPLRGEVQFFLHDTFLNDRPVVPVNTSGVAELNLVTYGAFTVGASADGGKTKLELDLSEISDAPADFRNS